MINSAWIKDFTLKIIQVQLTQVKIFSPCCLQPFCPRSYKNSQCTSKVQSTRSSFIYQYSINQFSLLFNHSRFRCIFVQFDTGINVDIKVINHLLCWKWQLQHREQPHRGILGKNRGTERKSLQSRGQNCHYFIFDKFFLRVNDIRECLLHSTFHAAFPSFICRDKKKKRKKNDKENKITFMWPCSDKLECIKLEEEKTNKQTKQSWTYTKMWFIFHGFYGKIDKFPFQRFRVSVRKMRSWVILDYLIIIQLSNNT